MHPSDLASHQQHLPIALAQVNAGDVPENLLNEIRQIIY